MALAFNVRSPPESKLSDAPDTAVIHGLCVRTERLDLHGTIGGQYAIDAIDCTDRERAIVCQIDRTIDVGRERADTIIGIGQNVIADTIQ